ncbi:MAG: response regulator [Thermoleophilaceae bacterium]|nr:response regulator [Thermoleophilaceae bacterium]
MADHIRGSSVLIVDDEPANLRLLATVLKREGLVPRPVPSGRLAIEAAVADPPDLVLLDVRMPEMSGFEVCRWFKQDERLRQIPVVFLSGLQGTDDKVEAFRVGAVDFVAKPFQDQEVLARVKTHLRLRRLQVEMVSHTEELERRVAEQVKVVTGSQLATIFALAKLAEARDDDTGHHIERVRGFARLLARTLRETHPDEKLLTPQFEDNIFEVSPLHDIGKVAVPDAVLLKPGKLTPEEFEVIKTHTTKGARTLDTVLQRYPENAFLRMGCDIARSHHEKWAGGGYPDGLAGEAIPLSARIVAVADVYDAVRARRPYKEPMPHEKARGIILEGSGKHFDPRVVEAFRSVEAAFDSLYAELCD